LGIISPTDELIFFRGVGIPPTSRVNGDFSSKDDLWIFLQFLIEPTLSCGFLLVIQSLL
jgi:hypothetical protein